MIKETKEMSICYVKDLDASVRLLNIICSLHLSDDML